MSDVWRVVAVLALVLGNAIFVAAEYALVTARRNRLEERAGNGNRRARTALRLMDEPVRFISTVQVGITVLSIAPLLGDAITRIHTGQSIGELLSSLEEGANEGISV